MCQCQWFILFYSLRLLCFPSSLSSFPPFLSSYSPLLLFLDRLLLLDLERRLLLPFLDAERDLARLAAFFGDLERLDALQTSFLVSCFSLEIYSWTWTWTWTWTSTSIFGLGWAFWQRYVTRMMMSYREQLYLLFGSGRIRRHPTEISKNIAG